jgi:hypothetical protein
MKSPRRPTIDTDLQQVSEEIIEIRAKLTAYLVQREQERYTFLLMRQAKLSRVISQRNKEHQEPTR